MTQLTHEDRFIQQVARATGCLLTPEILKALRSALAVYTRAERGGARGLPCINDTKLKEEIKRICLEHEIEPADLKRPYTRKAPTKIVNARKDIARQLYGSYNITLVRLSAAIGNLHHSTMLYYYYGHRPSGYAPIATLNANH